MKKNIKTRWSSLVAVAVAAISIQLAPLALALTPQETAIITDINAALTAASTGHNITSASGSEIQQALKCLSQFRLIFQWQLLQSQ